MHDRTGIVVSLGSNAIDIVIGTPPTVQFLQRQTDAKYLFRVYERFVLRIRDEDKPPVAGFKIEPGTDIRVQEAQALEDLAAIATLLPNAKLAMASRQLRKARRQKK